MEPPVERVRISQAAKDQLIKLKRVTKIDQWNILCRWAFCRSLAEPSSPSPVSISTDSNVEMTWQIFGGEMSELLITALKQKCYSDRIDMGKDNLATQFRLHLHRGIGYISADMKLKSIENLVASTQVLTESLIGGHIK
jgi:DNA sulfur modification protein DndE